MRYCTHILIYLIFFPLLIIFLPIPVICLPTWVLFVPITQCSYLKSVFFVPTYNQETICEITFPSSVLNVKLNRERVVICLETQIHIYELASMKCVQILSTAPNPSGLLALSGESSSYLVFPSGVLPTSMIFTVCEYS